MERASLKIEGQGHPLPRQVVVVGADEQTADDYERHVTIIFICSFNQGRLTPLQEAADRGIAFQTDGDFIRAASFSMGADLGE
jgi:hypothetical protein